ncbi:hypothetical protein HY357_03955 [Candidatus Roizmanbacteria bacterium]|nr:hypothetical protein [Candidatus Roizmanbacteria bacterium]
MTIYTCDALVVSCIDFRFQKFIRKWLDKNMEGKTYDYVGFAGGTKDLKTIKKQLAISVKLHHISQVVLIHHEDCGAYGKQSTHAKHSQDLKKARRTIKKLYPKLQVYTYYIDLSGSFEKIK